MSTLSAFRGLSTDIPSTAGAGRYTAKDTLWPKGGGVGGTLT